MEKGRYRFLATIEHCQNNSKFHKLVCIDVLNNVLPFSLDFASFLRYSIHVCKKTSIVFVCQLQTLRGKLAFFGYIISRKRSKSSEKTKTGHFLP